MADEYIHKHDAINVAESYQVERTGFHLNDYEYGRNQVAYSIASDLEDIESADVAPVVHAYWIDTDSYLGYFANCSACGYQMDVHAERGYFKYCPNCGAKMDGEEREHGK